MSFETYRFCVMCGSVFERKGKKKYCSTTCADRARKRREARRKLRIRNFKPSRGRTGEINVITTKNKLSFIPALYCITLLEADKWCTSHYPKKEREWIMEQVICVFESERKGIE